jgi:hypothetical protein
MVTSQLPRKHYEDPMETISENKFLGGELGAYSHCWTATANRSLNNLHPVRCDTITQPNLSHTSGKTTGIFQRKDQ